MIKLMRALALLALWGELALGSKAYDYQTFSVGQVLTAAQVQSLMDSVRDHVHGSDSVSGDVPNTAATQANQETGTSLVTIVTPGRQQFHQSAAKAWARGDAAGSVGNAYNATVSDTGTGIATWNWGDDFSGVTYAAVPGFHATAFNGSVRVSAQAAGTMEVTVTDYAGVATDPVVHFVIACGDQS